MLLVLLLVLLVLLLGIVKSTEGVLALAGIAVERIWVEGSRSRMGLKMTEGLLLLLLLLLLL